MSSENIHPALAAALEARGYATLTPVQLAVIEPEARDRDLLVSARTGSGKTVAYGLVLADTLFAHDGTLAAPGAPQALVIAPTRELAMQVQRELQWLYSGARVVSCVGGMDPRAERRALDAGCQIVVGTPGRLRDHLERGNLRLGELGAVILDEADEMLDLGFREEIEEILDSTPSERRTLLFSATLPKPIVTLAATYQKNALRLTVGGGESAHTDIEYRAMRIAPSEVELATVNVLRYFESGAAIVFCNTRDGVRKLHANLVERGFNVVALSGELTQNERTHALQALRDRRARVCVATDVAARGIDIPDLDLVIHADIPANRETLQHRSGRTGRAGRKGVCVILVPHPKRRKLDLLLKGAKIDAIWQSPPTADDIRAKDEARLIEDVLPATEAPEDDLAVARALMEKRTPEDIAAAYVRLARTQMPAPEDLAESEPEPQGYGQSQGRYKDRNQGDRGADRSAGDRYESRQSRGPERVEPPRPGFEDAVWFKIDLGRNKNAEARWILPMLCRRGHATKGDIGAIRIFDRETRFQIVAAAVERFEAASAKDVGDGGRIMRLEDGASSPGSDRPAPRPRPPRDDAKPFVKRGDGDRPFKPRDDAAPPKPYAKPREDGPLPRKFKDRAPVAEAGWSPVEHAAAPAPAEWVKTPYKGKQPHPKPKKKRKPNG